MLELRGGWKWHKEFMRLKAGWSSVAICHVCKAQSRGDLSYHVLLYTFLGIYIYTIYIYIYVFVFMFSRNFKEIDTGGLT